MNIQTAIKNKPFLWTTAGIGTVLGVYVAAWFGAAAALQHQAGLWISAKRSDGLLVTHDAPQISGFPGRMTITYAGWEVAGPPVGGAWVWRTNAVRVWAEPWSPLRFTVDLAGDHTVTGLWTPVGVTATVSAVRADLQPVLTTSGEIGEVSVAVDQLSITDPSGPLAMAAIESGTFSLTPVPDQDSAGWRVMLNAENWRVTPMTAYAAFAPNAKRIRLTADVLGPVAAAALPSALEVWHQGGGTIEVRDFLFEWSPLSIAATGTLALDGALQPVGAMTATFRGFFETVDAMAAHGEIRKDDVNAARVVLGLLARAPADGGAPELSIAVTIQNGKLYVGPLPLMQMPILNWPATIPLP